MSTAEQAQLTATIQALSAQRGLLGDLVVDTALAPLRARLAELVAAAAAPAPAARQSLRQVTILFLDVVGSTALAQQLDPEDIHLVMDGTLARCTTVVARHGGRVLQYAGDNLLAAFGADEAREDDAERAVHCGLALLAEGRLQAAEVQRRHGHAGFNVRVGLHTGAVLLGGGVDADGSIRGQPVNIAARMEQTAPPGGLRISQDTYRQVRGVFEVEPQPPISVKGLAEPMLTYLVARAKPRAFRAGTRGIEGVETRMIGRDAELARLQQAFERTLAQRQLQIVTVVADAGVGKSRLLYEFGNWAEDRSEPFYMLQGRAHPQTEGQPFGLLRDVLAWRLQIADSDSLALARQKIEHGIVPLFTADDGPELAQAHAHILGHLIGLDFSDSPHLRGILDDPQQIRTRGFHAAAQAFRRISASFDARGNVPIVLQLDDLHWADDGTLAFLQHLARANHDVPILMLALTRPTLFERRADWPGAAAQALHQRIDLLPLDKATSQQLAGELLKKLPEVPVVLSELIIGRSEGNPFYMEELVKMLVDQGALQTGPERWALNADRLLTTAVPPTLTGVLQARLDGLPSHERVALQESSVIGLVFWDQALGALDADAPRSLPALVRRELALPRPDAELDGVREYAFKHQFLHEVTYGTLLKRTRRALHARAAAWLAERTGARASDFLGATAEHYEKADEPAQACEYYARAGERARKRFAHEAALGYVQRGLAQLALVDAADPLDRDALRWRLLDVRERTLELQGRRPEQRADLDALQQLAEAAGHGLRLAELATRRSLMAGRTADFPGMAAAARDAMRLAADAGDDSVRLNAQRLLADALTRMGDVHAGHGLAISGLSEARALGLQGVEARFLNALSVIAGRRHDLVTMLQLVQQATNLRRALGDRRNEAIGLASLGSTWLELGDLDRARATLGQALKLHRAVGDRALEPIALANLSQLALWEGDVPLARRHAEAALQQAQAVQAVELQAMAHWSLGHVDLKAGRLDAARAAFTQTLAIARPGGSPMQHDAAAGLARVALAGGDVVAASACLVDVLAAWDGVSAMAEQLPGTLAVHLIEWTCIEALQQAADPRADGLLAVTHAALQARALTLSDPALRASFLAQVPENAALVAAWQARSGRR